MARGLQHLPWGGWLREQGLFRLGKRQPWGGITVTFPELGQAHQEDGAWHFSVKQEATNRCWWKRVLQWEQGENFPLRGHPNIGTGCPEEVMHPPSLGGLETRLDKALSNLTAHLGLGDPFRYPLNWTALWFYVLLLLLFYFLWEVERLLKKCHLQSLYSLSFQS